LCIRFASAFIGFLSILKFCGMSMITTSCPKDEPSAYVAVLNGDVFLGLEGDVSELEEFGVEAQVSQLEGLVVSYRLVALHSNLNI